MATGNDDEIDELIKPAGDTSLPWLLAVDANGHVRFKEGGQAVEHDVLIAQIDELVRDPYGN